MPIFILVSGFSSASLRRIVIMLLLINVICTSPFHTICVVCMCEVISFLVLTQNPKAVYTHTHIYGHLVSAVQLGQLAPACQLLVWLCIILQTYREETNKTVQSWVTASSRPSRSWTVSPSIVCCCAPTCLSHVSWSPLASNLTGILLHEHALHHFTC